MFLQHRFFAFVGQTTIHQEAGPCAGIDTEIAKQSPDVVRKNMGHFTAFLPVPAGVRHPSVQQSGVPCVQRRAAASLSPTHFAHGARAEEKA
jgi:hypothetical protein